MVVTKFRIYFCKPKNCEYDQDFYILDILSLASPKPNFLTLLMKKKLLDSDKKLILSLPDEQQKGIKFINLNTEDSRYN